MNEKPSSETRKLVMQAACGFLKTYLLPQIPDTGRFTAEFSHYLKATGEWFVDIMYQQDIDRGLVGTMTLSDAGEVPIYTTPDEIMENVRRQNSLSLRIA